MTSTSKTASPDAHEAAVRVAIEDRIAIVTIDNPPVNAASHAVRAGLLEAVRTAEEAGARAAVLIGAGDSFVAGADVREFGQPPRAPLLPEVVRALEKTPVPFIAAIDGNALGGGLELALGCAYRIATPRAKFGMPEVNLGLIPGAGGTVRLPRLVPVLEALMMITSGKPVGTRKALDIGLIDDVAEGDLLQAARDLALQIDGRERPLALLSREPVIVPDVHSWQIAVNDATKKTRGQNAPREAANALRDAIDMAPDAALEAERARFLKLKDDPQSAALRHIFFAERSVARMDRLKGVEPRKVDHVGIVGGGTMGAGIAAATLLAGLPVTLIERDDAALEAGRERVGKLLDGAERRGLIDTARRAAIDASLAGATDYDALASADLVIEAVFEDMAVKTEVFERLDRATRPDAVLATNTSYLDVGAMAEVVADPGRVLGLHFFSPAHVMKLLEVVHPPKVADDVLATGFAFGKRLRKICVPAGVCDGFIGNRIMSAYRREAGYLLEEGALPHEVDAAMTDYGFAMGIYAMQDMAGLDIAWAMRKRRAATRDPNERYVDIADTLCEAGRFGQKTGKGWYLHDGTSRTGRPDPEVEAIIVDASRRKGIERRSFSHEQIIDRLLGALRAEADAVLAEGIAASPDAIDVVMVNGYGFPRWRGGPMFATRKG
ncbi:MULTISPECIES: 3-hydroxyacyl-CoA dehydrogenase NAD-binding domain-containing protein [unclassified Roseitalea]|uniref:3-hydroxyacyl-CoA dehydrogenase NAD-binding domain-containing protein n=1 Tax=unclassified Roseitalea TaxID=2639107 RepID=UPI00273DE19B|nr:MULTISPECIES: 3-hydroxyacyl-CoA dehydrogenase NAD-binding domain-containing protein [unclassified Roseitalea]